MIALVALLVVGVARADIPPPEGYVERCTVEVCGSAVGTMCRASFQGREACEALEAQGYVARCRTRGASVWGEALCKPEAQAPSGSVGSPQAKGGAEGEPSATPPPSQQAAPSSGSDHLEACTPAGCPEGAGGQTCDASFEGRPDCEALEAKGYVRACKTAGASVWTEVMCPAPARPPAGASGPIASSGGCASAPGPARGGLLALLAIGTLARRRRV